MIVYISRNEIDQFYWSIDQMLRAQNMNMRLLINSISLSVIPSPVYSFLVSIDPSLISAHDLLHCSEGHLRTILLNMSVILGNLDPTAPYFSYETSPVPVLGFASLGYALNSRPSNNNVHAHSNQTPRYSRPGVGMSGDARNMQGFGTSGYALHSHPNANRNMSARADDAPRYSSAPGYGSNHHQHH